MSPIKRALARSIAVVFVVALAACGFDSKSPVAESLTATTPSPSASPIAGVVGQAFVFHSSGGVSGVPATPTDVSLTIKPFACGYKGYTIPADVYGEVKKWDAPPGMRYCEADITVKNPSRHPVGEFRFHGILTTTDGATYNNDDQATNDVGGLLTSNNAEWTGDFTTPDLNPGQTARTAIVWAIPKGAAPAKLEIWEESTGEGFTSSVIVQPSQIKWIHPQGQ